MNGGPNEWLRRLLFLPPQASTVALPVDQLHYFVVLTTVVVSALLGLVTLYFIIRYRERVPRAQTPAVRPTWWMEAPIVGVPLFFFLVWFGLGYQQYLHITTPPAGAMEVYVTGKQWMWKFAYTDGPSAINVLHVPAGRPVKLLITSRDVIHSFFVPDFRIKRDALPGRYTQIWFTANRPGHHRVYCAEYCGLRHSMMIGWVEVLPPADFDRWMAQNRLGRARQDDGGSLAGGGVSTSMAVEGQRLAARHGCLGCHSIDGTIGIGPTWQNLYRRQERLLDGRTIVADESYLTESMMDPLAKVVAGFVPVMPTYLGRLTPAEVGCLLAFIKSLHLPGIPRRGPATSESSDAAQPVGVPGRP
jgi:cytochrome c oxidase subunit 2